MKLLLVATLLLLTFSVCHAYEKWEAIASNKDTTCYINEDNISQRSDTEYFITLRFDSKKASKIPVTETTYIKGKAKKVNTHKLSKAEVVTAILDTQKMKMYIQSRYYITDDGDIPGTVSPEDVFLSDSPIFQETFGIVKARFMKQPANDNINSDENPNDNAIKQGVAQFLETSESNGMMGVTSLSLDCYERSHKNNEISSFVLCAAIDTAAMHWDKFIAKEYNFPPTEYFLQQNVVARINAELRRFKVAENDTESIRNGMMSAIYDAYLAELKKKQKE